MARFVCAKREQTRRLVREEGAWMPKEGWKLFDAVLANDLGRATRLYNDLATQSGKYGGTPPPPGFPARYSGAIGSLLTRLGVHTPNPRPRALQTSAWQPLMEAYWAYHVSRSWTPDLLSMFAEGVRTNVASNAIYFGATDPGRFTISARMSSHTDGLPFFVLTQNQLGDGTYLKYLESMFGKQLNLVSSDDCESAFNTYLEEAKNRFLAGAPKSGEVVQMSGGSIVAATGERPLLEYSAQLVRMIFEKNPGREFYIEEVWPLDWLYPYLSPAGPVFKVNRWPLKTLTDEVVQKDRTYWNGIVHRLIGDWLNEETPLEEILRFIERTYFERDLRGFSGDPRYLSDALAWDGFGRWRWLIADLYRWRSIHDQTAEERQRMAKAADYSFRQAFALSPNSIKLAAIFAEYLRREGRTEDAVKVVEICRRWHSQDQFLRRLQEQIKTNAPSLIAITNFFGP